MLQPNMGRNDSQILLPSCIVDLSGSCEATCTVGSVCGVGIAALQEPSCLVLTHSALSTQHFLLSSHLSWLVGYGTASSCNMGEG